MNNNSLEFEDWTKIAESEETITYYHKNGPFS